jgi:hypothetical protein
MEEEEVNGWMLSLWSRALYLPLQDLVPHLEQLGAQRTLTKDGEERWRVFNEFYCLIFMISHYFEIQSVD